MKKMMTTVLAAAIIAGLATSTATAYSPSVSITAENAAINDQGSLVDDGHVYLAVRKGEPDMPWVTDATSYQGSQAVAMRIGPTTGAGPDNGTDKINHRVVWGHDAFAPSLTGDTSVFEFAVALDAEHFDPVTGSFLFAQWWQGSPHVPPLSLHLVPETFPPRWYAEVRNNDTGSNLSAAGIKLGGGTLVPGTWYHFTVETAFRPTGAGSIRLWVDGEQMIDWSGAMGYLPARDGGRSGTNPAIEVSYGPYRTRQEREHLLYFDDISFGKS